jgi:hypothetical protein
MQPNLGPRTRIRSAKLLRLVSIALPLAFGTSVFAQSKSPEPALKTPLELASDKILDAISSVPPELAASATLTVVETNHKLSHERAAELIANAYTLANQSAYPVKFQFTGANMETRDGYLWRGFGENIDGLSLKSRAVKAMLLIDPAEARRLFQQIGQVALTNRACSDDLVYDPSGYYDAAESVYSKGFTAEEIRQGLRSEFLESVMRQVSHASEVPPSEQMLEKLALPQDQSTSAQLALGRALTQIHGDDKSFLQTKQQVVTNLFHFDQITRGRLARPLLQGAHDYMVANAQDPSCEPPPAQPNAANASSGLPDPSRKPDPALALNELLVRYGIKPIDASELVPQSIDPAGQTRPQPYWQSAAAKDLMAKFRRLQSGPNSARKNSAEWQDEAQALILALRSWTDTSSESGPDALFLQKSQMYENLLGILPTGSSAFPDATEDFVAFLASPPESDESRPFYLHTISTLVQTFRKGPDLKVKQAILETALARSPNPIVVLYSALLALPSTPSTAASSEKQP